MLQDTTPISTTTVSFSGQEIPPKSNKRFFLIVGLIVLTLLIVGGFVGADTWKKEKQKAENAYNLGGQAAINSVIKTAQDYYESGQCLYFQTEKERYTFCPYKINLNEEATSTLPQ